MKKKNKEKKMSKKNKKSQNVKSKKELISLTIQDEKSSPSYWIFGISGSLIKGKDPTDDTYDESAKSKSRSLTLMQDTPGSVGDQLKHIKRIEKISDAYLEAGDGITCFERWNLTTPEGQSELEKYIDRLNSQKNFRDVPNPKVEHLLIDSAPFYFPGVTTFPDISKKALDYLLHLKNKYNMGIVASFEHASRYHVPPNFYEKSDRVIGAIKPVYPGSPQNRLIDLKF